MTFQDIVNHCPTVTEITEDETAPWEFVLFVRLKPGSRANRTQKYVQRYVDCNRIVGHRVTVKVVVK